MRRVDTFREGFDPHQGNGGHIVHLMDSDTHRVELSGDHLEVRLIVDALKAMSGQARADEAMGHPTRYREATINAVVAGIEVPHFEQASAEAAVPAD